MTWPTLPPSCVLAEVGATPVLFDQRSGAMIVLDSVAAFVVRHRDHFADFAEAAGALADTFDTDPARVGADLHQLVSRINEFDRDEESHASSSIGPRAAAPSGTDVTAWRFDALGRVLEVACHDKDLAGMIGPLLAAHPCALAPPVHRFDVWVDGPGITVAQDGAVFYDRVPLAPAIGGLLASITAVTMFESNSGLVAHAAAVAIGDDVIVMGGGSNQGKSTTTIELMGRGLVYLSDEIVALQPTSGRVTGLARPIGLEGPMRERWPHLRPPWLGRDEPRWLVAPASLGDVAESGTLRLFVVLEFAESGSTRVEQLEVLDAVASVGTLTYNRGSIAETTLVQLGKLFGRTPAVRVQHRGAEAAADAVLDTYQRLAANVVD